MPETLAAAELINSWLAEHRPEAGAVAAGRLRILGTADFFSGARQSSRSPSPIGFICYCVPNMSLLIYQIRKAIKDCIAREIWHKRVLTTALSRCIVRSGNLRCE